MHMLKTLAGPPPPLDNICSRPRPHPLATTQQTAPCSLQSVSPLTLISSLLLLGIFLPIVLPPISLYPLRALHCTPEGGR